MIEIALATVLVVELLKRSLPPLQPWAKVLIATALVGLGGWAFDLPPLEIVGAWGLSYALYVPLRAFIAMGDYFRVEVFLRSQRPRHR